jgi:hypothetical protein
MAANDRFVSQSSLVGPGDDAFVISTSDTVDLASVTRAIYVGVTGDVAVITKGGTTLTFTAVPAGAVIPVRVSRVKATGTTATNMVGLI